MDVPAPAAPDVMIACRRCGGRVLRSHLVSAAKPGCTWCGHPIDIPTTGASAARKTT